jgi:NADH:ubiquinone oxidoreductase subunit 6 (subunit J)
VIELGLFWICCLTTMAGALGAAVVRNLFHAALLLGLCLVGMAGLYLFLEASYLACIQIIVYVGGVLVLMLFATLFSSDIMGAVQRTPLWLRLTGLVGAALAAVVAGRLSQIAVAHAANLSQTRSQPGALPDVIDGAAGSTQVIGDLLVGSWLPAFLIAGMLLTAALIGAVSIVRRYRRPEAKRA